MECPRSTSSSGSDLDPEIELKCGTCKALKMSQRSTEHLQPSALFDEVEVGVADILEQAESGCTSCRLLIEAIEITLKQPPRNGAKKPAELVRKFSIARPKDAYFSITLLNYEYHSAEFEIITSSDDPSPWKAIPFKPGLGARLDSPSCYETIRAWMARCEQEHPECKQTVHHQLPRRVIRIGQTGAEPPLRLYESQGHEDKEYLALSHCWGDPATVPSLTQATLLPYSQQIPNNILSNTFSDAVEITRKLGYRYIWIDALCIVQDDPEDWAREAAKMARIYTEASLTISAVSSVDGTGGCFYERQGGRDIELSTIGPGSARFSVRLAVHSFCSSLFDTKPGFEHPLIRRKWVFQERMLSRRVVYYTTDELVWECRDEAWCEFGPEDGPSRQGPQTQSSDKSRFVELGRFCQGLTTEEDRRQAIRTWYKLVTEYSTRHLTYSTDVFPAFSAIARSFQDYGADKIGAYHAGMWDYGLLVSLCWSTFFDYRSVPRRRPQTYCAPTWSWASIQGPVDFESPEPNQCETAQEGDAKVISVHCELAQHRDTGLVDPFGQILGGMLVLEAFALETVIVCVYDRPSHDGFRGQIQFEHWKGRHACWFDTEDDRVNVEGRQVWILLLTQGRYLLVTRIGMDETFRRIAFGKVDSRDVVFARKVKRSSRTVFKIL